MAVFIPTTHACCILLGITTDYYNYNKRYHPMHEEGFGNDHPVKNRCNIGLLQHMFNFLLFVG